MNQNNEHLDVQVYVQIRVTSYSLQTQPSHHSQTRVILNQFSAKAEQAIIANHLKVRLISPAVAVIVDQTTNNFMSMILASWSILLQEQNKKIMFAKYQRSSCILQLQKEDKNQKLCKPRMSGTRSKLNFIIGYKFDILSL